MDFIDCLNDKTKLARSIAFVSEMLFFTEGDVQMIANDKGKIENW